jgi:hypothetical protein
MRAKRRSKAESYWRESGLAALVARFDEVRFAGSGDAAAPIAPNVNDLVRLHRLVRERRRFTVLEFGVGYSTLVLAHALQMNEKEFRPRAHPKVRLGRDAFRVVSIDASAHWIENVRRGLPDDLAMRVELHHSTVSATTFNGMLCHMYDRLPDVVADFIYVDGPDPRDVAGDVRGLGFSSGERVPISADLLLMEPTLLPGTIVLVDGRTANARFLTRNFQRRYRVRYDRTADVTTFELSEPPLGLRDAARIAYQRTGRQAG